MYIKNSNPTFFFAFTHNKEFNTPLQNITQGKVVMRTFYGDD